MSRVLGAKRVVGGVSYHSAALEDLGHVNHINSGSTFICELDGTMSLRLKSLENVFQDALLSPEITNDILGVIWGKFIVNSGMNPLCAVIELRSGEISENTAADEM
ncbi:MAG: hypothetical protein CMM24_02395 [Rhodospirillaceae bacterium]|nr:hypothetical protein [Rhodospirillaceae bacterium]